MIRPFAQVDVFASGPLLGNPVAVVLEAEGLTTEEMARFARWTNLSETTFVTAPTHADADYAVRIFTPHEELPFAGHPTLGTCHAWLAAGGRPRGAEIIQECGIGLVTVRQRDADVLAFAAPARRRSGPLDPAEADLIRTALGLRPEEVVAHEWCDNGPPWQALLLSSDDAVRRATPDAMVLGNRYVGLVGPGGDADVEVRAFFPTGSGIGEDPVTGSLNAALGQWLIAAGRLPARYEAAQGMAMGRAGRVLLECIGDTVWVGGRCVPVLTGSAALSSD